MGKPRKDRHDIALLRDTFAYDPATGHITAKTYLSSRAQEGQRVGTRNKRTGYRRVVFQGVDYPEHALAFALMTGRWPQDTTDHKNCVRDDNRWENLREATYAQNKANSHYRRSKHPGLKGAYKNCAGNYQSAISKGGRLRYLGVFKTEKEAHEAYTKAAREQHGEFARTQSFWFD